MAPLFKRGKGEAVTTRSNFTAQQRQLDAMFERRFAQILLDTAVTLTSPEIDRPTEPISMLYGVPDKSIDVDVWKLGNLEGYTYYLTIGGQLVRRRSTYPSFMLADLQPTVLVCFSLQTELLKLARKLTPY